ncbi:MAG: PEP-CTERM sorting domain-containing protein [Tepidisphaeraceae bacterium]
MSAIWVLLAGAVALNVAAPRARASVITGGISFFGNVTPYLTTTGTGTPATDFTLAKSLVFGPSTVASGANGSFSGIAAGTPVTMYSPLEINSPSLPVPATTPLWQVVSGGVTYSLTLSTLTEPLDTSTALELTGAGVLTDGNPADASTGTWVATFTTSGSTYSWNASSAATVPEPAALALVAFGGLALLRRR